MDLDARAELYARNATIDLRPDLPEGLSADGYLAVRRAIKSAFLNGLAVAVEPSLSREVATWMRPTR